MDSTESVRHRTWHRLRCSSRYVRKESNLETILTLQTSTGLVHQWMFLSIEPYLAPVTIIPQFTYCVKILLDIREKGLRYKKVAPPYWMQPQNTTFKITRILSK
jgi:hypothetical protein